MRYDVCTFFLGKSEQVTVKAVRVDKLRISRSFAAVDGRNPFFLQWRRDSYITYVHMQGVRFDAALNDVIGQPDAFDCESLHE